MASPKQPTKSGGAPGSLDASETRDAEAAAVGDGSPAPKRLTGKRKTKLTKKGSRKTMTPKKGGGGGGGGAPGESADASAQPADDGAGGPMAPLDEDAEDEGGRTGHDGGGDASPKSPSSPRAKLKGALAKVKGAAALGGDVVPGGGSSRASAVFRLVDTGPLVKDAPPSHLSGCVVARPASLTLCCGGGGMAGSSYEPLRRGARRRGGRWVLSTLLAARHRRARARF